MPTPPRNARPELQGQRAHCQRVYFTFDEFNSLCALANAAGQGIGSWIERAALEAALARESQLALEAPREPVE